MELQPSSWNFKFCVSMFQLSLTLVLRKILQSFSQNAKGSFPLTYKFNYQIRSYLVSLYALYFYFTQFLKACEKE
jgi:hypothetical protein